MAVLRPPFDISEVTLFTEPDRLIRFSDRYKDLPATTNPSRFEGASMFVARVVPRSGATDFAVRWPTEGAARVVDLSPSDAGAIGLSKLLEISLFPFGLSDVLRAMPGGVPTFYFGYADPAYPDQDDTVRTIESPPRVKSGVFGVMFQDRAALAPWGWFERIAAAVRIARPSEASTWDAWSALYTGRRTLRLLDACGRPPVAGQQITLAITDSGGNAVSSQTLTSDSNGDLPGLSLPGAGQSAAISWTPNPSAGEPALPVMALVDRVGDSTPGDNVFSLHADFAGGHLQLLDLARWLAPGQHSDPILAGQGARYRLNSRMQPLVDGLPVFNAILKDLEFAKGANGAAHFAGWAFTDFAMNPGVDATSLYNLSQAILNQGGDVRILVAQFLQASDTGLENLSIELGLFFTLLLGACNPVGLITAAGKTDNVGLGLWAVFAAGLVLAYIKYLSSGDSVADVIRKVSEQTKPDFFDKLSSLNGSHFNVLRSPHPATIEDNPIAGDITLPDGRPLRDLQDRWGVFHQKIQLIKYADGTAPAATTRHVAYLGGVDINQNRVDTPGHQGAGYRDPGPVDDPVNYDPIAAPFHDVHCRITGPAASDVFAVFAERYRQVVHALPPTAVPTPAELGAAGRNVIQIAQTSFRPQPGGEARAFDWAPEGNTTTHDTIINAIKAAKELIYIEEQYMVPDNAYIDALIGAAEHCQRLIIVLPSFLEILFGDRRRGEMFNQMQIAWGERLLIGTPMRRPVLAPAGRVASTGRFTLLADIGPTESSVFVAPPARVPKGGFFFWIGGELMYATGSTDTTGPGGVPAKRLDVLRGGNGSTERWCPNPRTHVAGEPVTASQPTGIFVHAKIMMVDDVFVSIGSTNINRRGFFHDGEINAFPIPYELKGASDNPARDLRTRLWAEQLGLAPDMGAALLADPIESFELWKRRHTEGNRFVPLSQLKVPVPSLSELPSAFDAIPTWAKQILQFGFQDAFELFSDAIFNTLSDPTSYSDAHPAPGPEFP